MNSLNNRIHSSSVQLGESFVLNSSSLKEKQRSMQEEMEKKLQARSDEILAKADSKAQEILNQAIIEAENIKKQALEQGTKDGNAQGFEQGYKEAVNKFTQETLDLVKTLKVISEATSEVKKEIIFSAEQEVLELSILIAEKIVMQELKTDSKSLLNIIKSSILELKEKNDVKILINPCHSDNLKKFSAEIKKEINDLEQIKFISDKTVSPYGIIVETDKKRIDASLEAQIEEISQKIFKELNSKAAKKTVPKEVDEKITKKAEEKKKNAKS